MAWLGRFGSFFCLLLILLSPAAAHADGPRFATVTAKKAPIYSAPDESAPVKATARKGDFLEVGAIRGEWVKVRTSEGLIGFVLKSDVVPGKRDLSGGGGGEGGGGEGGGGRIHRGGGGEEGAESRTGLSAKVGLQFAANSYSFKGDSGGAAVNQSVGMKVAYTGLNAEGDYWIIPMFGVHARFASAFGSQNVTLLAPVNKKVDRIPSNINRIEVDAEGRYFFGDDPSAASITAHLGYHDNEMHIDPVVNANGDPLYLVTESYKGLALGVGANVPLGSPQLALRAGLDYWLSPSLTEGTTSATSKPSGTPNGVSGLGFGGGFDYAFSDTSGIDIGFEYDTFSSSFKGAGDRFNYSVTGAKANDNYLLFGVNGSFRF